jgi:hypothetical protein
MGFAGGTFCRKAGSDLVIGNVTGYTNKMIKASNGLQAVVSLTASTSRASKRVVSFVIEKGQRWQQRRREKRTSMQAQSRRALQTFIGKSGLQGCISHYLYPSINQYLVPAKTPVFLEANGLKVLFSALSREGPTQHMGCYWSSTLCWVAPLFKGYPPPFCVCPCKGRCALVRGGTEPTKCSSRESINLP